MTVSVLSLLDACVYHDHDYDVDLDWDMLDYYYFLKYPHLVLKLAKHDLSPNPIHNYDDACLTEFDEIFLDT